jgi:hypothetical protein
VRASRCRRARGPHLREPHREIRAGSAEQVALHAGDPELHESGQLRDALDALSDDVEPVRLGQRDDRPEDGLPALGADLPHERLVDLQDVHGQQREPGERAVAGPEVVE